MNKIAINYFACYFTGKTWSMQGAPEGGELQGIIPRLNNALFDQIESVRKTRPSLQFLVTASYFEIYNEVIFDLLDANDRKKKSNTGKGGLEIKEHPILGVYVKGLQEHVVENAIKLQKIIDQGMKSRTVASTQMNADSSRSHSVFVITVRQKDTLNEEKNIFAKVNLVDLAGSERVKSTGASGATLKEGANINKSLSELGNVINALVALAKGKKGVFVPYRNSKLTRVLQESLGGNSITAMLAALSPAGSYFDETLSTLKYANRAKAIKVGLISSISISVHFFHFQLILTFYLLSQFFYFQQSYLFHFFDFLLFMFLFVFLFEPLFYFLITNIIMMTNFKLGISLKLSTLLNFSEFGVKYFFQCFSYFFHFVIVIIVILN